MVEDAERRRVVLRVHFPLRTRGGTWLRSEWAGGARSVARQGEVPSGKDGGALDGHERSSHADDADQRHEESEDDLGDDLVRGTRRRE